MYSVNTTLVFQKTARKLAKKYRNLQQDLLPVLDCLEHGTFAGDPVPGFEGSIYKVRIRSSDQQKGKRGGFRMIYLIDQVNRKIWLLTLYAKAKQENIRVNEIQQLLDDLFSSPDTSEE
ncbi:MAG: type II toxin-antitoxin system RelE/ParE family toxin [Candidatus Electrothrix sp. EH2]|nr:type II toxin-antitoxin system RelE/ParE family toxin [Candidatus Electrothrix sp. EH2]